MSGIGSGYDLSPSTFSPDGRIFQSEYSLKAVESSGTVIGITCTDGVVLCLEKNKPSKLVINSYRRIFNVDRHIGVAVAGLLPDGRKLVNYIIAEASNYKKLFGKPIPSNIICDRVASHVHLFNLYWYTRPYGATVLMAVYDHKGPSLFSIEPSGIAYKYHAFAIGKGRQAAKTEIEKLNLSTLTCKEALLEASKILLKVYYYYYY